MGRVTCYSHAVGRQNYAEYAALSFRHKEGEPRRTLHLATVNIHPVFESNLICVSHKYETIYN